MKLVALTTMWHGRPARGLPRTWASRPCHIQVAIALTFFAFLPIPALAQPTPDPASPAAISPSTGGEIVLHGTGLDKPLSLWSIPPAQVVFTNTSPTSATARLTFPQTVQDQFLA